MKKFFSFVLLLCVLASCALAEIDLLAKGDAYLQEGDVERAFVTYELALADHPNDISVLLHISGAHSAAGQNAQALALLEQALALDPACADAYLLRMRLTTESAPQDAYRDLLRAEVLESAPSGEDCARLDAALYADGDALKALALFERAGETARAEAYKTAYLRTLYATGHFEEAQRLSGGQASIDSQIAAVANSGKALCLKEISVFQDDVRYTYIFPAHAAKTDTGALTAKAVENAGGALQQDGSYRLDLSLQLIDELMDEAELVSISPDGSTILMRNNYCWYALRGDRLIYVAQTKDRGVPDAYGNLEKQLANYFFARSPGSVSWSPNGRNFTLTDYKKSLENGDFSTDLFVFDTQTGEAFVGAAYPNKIREGGATVIQTVFDTSGRYIYYVLYGAQYDYRVSLLRYDMQANTSELLYNGPEFAAYPTLAMDAEGRLMNAIDAIEMDQQIGLNLYAQTAEGWTNAQILSAVPFQLGTPFWMQYSADSQYGLLLRAADIYTYLSVFSTLDGCAGLNQMVSIDALSAKSASVQEITQESVQALISNPSSATPRIINAKLSPDGQYALLLVNVSYEYRLMLLTLKDLSLAPVECPFQINSAFIMDNRHGFTWASGTRVIVNAGEGARLYELSTAE